MPRQQAAYSLLAAAMGITQLSMLGMGPVFMSKEQAEKIRNAPPPDCPLCDAGVPLNNPPVQEKADDSTTEAG